MKTVKYNCFLCSKSDSLLLKNDEFGPQAIRNTFFAVNKKQFNEVHIRNARFCILCTHQLHLSVLLKKQYDEMCNRNHRTSSKKCFFCEEKGAKLIMLNHNPNSTHDKLNTFLKSVIIQHEYKDLQSCIRCLYNLDIWFAVRNKLYKSMNVPTNSVRNEDATNNNVTSIKPAISRARPVRRRQQTRRNNITAKDSKSSWKHYLQVKLKNFKTVDKLMEQESVSLNSTIIENDEDKLFNALPFVEIFVNSQINKEHILANKEDVIPTIVLTTDSDSDEINTNRRSLRRSKPNLSLRKSPRKRPKSKKTIFKIKLPIRTKLSLRKSLNEESSANDHDDSSRSSESSTNFSSGNESRDFTCNSCNKTFTSRCDYLLHDLKHKKTENLVVKVRRDRLSEEQNVEKIAEAQSRFSNDVNRLLSKWLGEDATKEKRNMDEVNENEKSKETNIEQAEDESPKRKPPDEENEEMSATKEIAADNEMEVDTTEPSESEKTKDEDPENKQSETSINIVSDKNEVEIINSDLENKSRGGNQSCENNDKSGKVSRNSNKKNNDKSDQNNDESETEDTSKPGGCGNVRQPAEETVKNIQVEISRSSNAEGDGVNDKSPEKSPTADKVINETNAKSEDASLKKPERTLDFNEDSNEDISSEPAMSCEDLLNILETNIDSEVSTSNAKSTENQEEKVTATERAPKRKRESSENEATPKKKRVRFAEKKEVFTSDKKGVVIETLIENDEFSQDDAEEVEEEDEKSTENKEKEIEEEESTENEEKETEEECTENKENETEEEEQEEKSTENKEKETEEEEEQGQRDETQKEVEVTEEDGNEAEEKGKETEEEEKEEKTKTKKVNEHNDKVLECEV